MLNQILNKVDFIKGLSLVVDKGYDLMSIIQKFLDIGLIPVIKIKQAFRVKIKYPLRQLLKDMAKKLAIAWTIFWNFYTILIYVFLFILSEFLILRRSFFDFWNSLCKYLTREKTSCNLSSCFNTSFKSLMFLFRL
jgi:hypothetical protein